MTEIDVTITDALLALECMLFVVLLARKPALNAPVRMALIALFCSLGASAMIGIIVHGFFNSGDAMTDLLWLWTMIVIGCAATSAWTLFAFATLAPAAARVVTLTAIAELVVYACIVVFVTQDFFVAIANYLPAAVALAVMFVMYALRTRAAAPWLGFTGMLLTFAAAGVQQAGFGLHPRYFNYNALYHLIQAAGFFLIYRGGSWIADRQPPARHHTI